MAQSKNTVYVKARQSYDNKSMLSKQPRHKFATNKPGTSPVHVPGFVDSKSNSGTVTVTVGRNISLQVGN